MIDLLLVDDHAMFRDGLARTFEKCEDMKVVGQFGSCSEALSALRLKPNMVLLDVDLGSERALKFIQTARKASYVGQILIVTAGISGAEAVQLIHAGVAGIIHKQQSAESLRTVIRRVASGDVYLEPCYLGALMRSADRSQPELRLRLTERDKAVIRYVLQGLTNREIAVHLSISESAVKASLRQLFEKLEVRTRAQLVKVALEQYRDLL